MPAGLPPEEQPRAALAAWAEVLPGTAVFTGLTPAEQHGLWLPPLPEDVPVFVGMLDGPVRRRRVGLRATRHTSPPAYVLLDGLRIAPVGETLLACARELGLLDLVVLIDSALHLRLVTRAELEALAALRRRGARRLREALPWCDGRSESAWETLLRLLHRACGIAVEPQVEIRAADGLFLARADLLVAGTRTLQEYDGAGHFERGQYGRDAPAAGAVGTGGRDRAEMTRFRRVESGAPQSAHSDGRFAATRSCLAPAPQSARIAS